MLQQLRLLFSAVQFFTRIPVPVWTGHSAQQLNQSARYFPAVGLLVGSISAATLWLTALLLPLSLAVVLSMIASILITGAFHEDGLSDFVDGMGGGYTPEKILSIMKDSHTGAYGVIALVLALLVKYQALLALCNSHSLAFVCAVIITAHAVSRLMAVSIMFSQTYVRHDDSARAKPAAQSLSHTSYVIALLTGAAALCLLIAAGASTSSLLIAFACAFLLRIYLALLMFKNIGGYTGDCLGAVQQLTEIAFYLGLLATL